MRKPISEAKAESLGSSRERHFKMVMTGPLIVVLIALMAFPVVLTICMSFSSWDLTLPGSFKLIGFKNYQKLFYDERFRNSLYVTGYYSLLAIVVQTGVGVLLAQLLHKSFPGRKVVIGLILMGMVASDVAVAMIWKVMYDPNLGIFNFILRWMGLPAQAWVFSSKTVLPALVLFDCWRGIPFIMLVTLAGFSMLPQEPFEAAQLDGARPLQAFWHISLPLLRPIIITGVIVRMIGIIKVFGPIYVISQGGPGTSSEVAYIYVYKHAFSYGRIAYASASSVVLFFLILAATAVLIKLRRATE